VKPSWLGVLLAIAAGSGVALINFGALSAHEARGRKRYLHACFENLRRHSQLAGALVAGGSAAYVIFGSVPFGIGGAVLGAWSAHQIRATRRARQAELLRAKWPYLLEEIRILTCNLGRSIPQALFEAARSSPPSLAALFLRAEREWLMTMDFAATVQVLEEDLSDPGADAALETLLVAHELGGFDLEQRLRVLIEDRTVDLAARKAAQAHQAGVRFARRFVIAVPLGMALVSLGIGTGKAAYASPAGVVALFAAGSSMAACWWWAGRLMRLPEPRRVVFDPERERA
jgi:tight adherence protein B